MSKDDTVCHLQKALADILGKIDAMKRQANNLRGTIEYFEGKDKSTVKHNGPGRPRKESSLPSPLIQEIILSIKEHGSPMHYKDIHQCLMDKGIPVGGKNPTQNMAAHMSLNKRYLEPIGGGKWGLVNPDDELSENLLEAQP